MIIESAAFARAGLIGNPSDGYFGKTIAVILKNFSASVRCFESTKLNIEPCQRDRMRFDDLSELVEDVRLNGYYGGLRLIKAAIKVFHTHCAEQSIALSSRNFTLEYQTDVPVRVGLAGSSAIVTATLRALMQFYQVPIENHLLANLALSVETDELKIGAGLQDRVAQAYEGVVFMDFKRSLMESRGYGEYESLAVEALPPLFVAYHSDLAEGTEVSHNDLRSRFHRGDTEVLQAMNEFAGLAQAARDLLVAGRGSELGPLLSENFALRKRILKIGPGNQKLVSIAEGLGCQAKFAGSGGAVVGLYDGDPQRFEALAQAYANFGARIIKPIVSNRDSHD